MKGVQCYELFGGIALKIHIFSFFIFISKTIKNYLDILPSNHKTNRIFVTNSILVEFKRERNLRDCFILSKLNRDNNTVETPGTTNNNG